MEQIKDTKEVFQVESQAAAPRVSAIWLKLGDFEKPKSQRHKDKDKDKDRDKDKYKDIKGTKEGLLVIYQQDP